LTEEIITHFRLPYNLCYNFIYNRVAWALAVGFDLGKAQNSFRKSIVQYDDVKGIMKVYSSIKEASRAMDIDQSALSKACLGKYKGKLKGYKWRYLNSDDYYKARNIKINRDETRN